MNAKTTRVLVVGGLLFVCVIMIVSWTIFRAVPWLVFDGGAKSLEQGWTKSYHAALGDGDTAVQLRILEEQFAPLIRQDDEGAAWIRKEFSDDLSALVGSADPSVAKAASNILSMLDAQPVPPRGG